MTDIADFISKLMGMIPMGEEEAQSHVKFAEKVKEMAQEFAIPEEKHEIFHLLVLSLDLASANWLSSVSLSKMLPLPDVLLIESGNKTLVIYLVNLIHKLCPDVDFNELQDKLGKYMNELDGIKLEPYKSEEKEGEEEFEIDMSELGLDREAEEDGWKDR